jgi:hypothetical protein
MAEELQTRIRKLALAPNDVVVISTNHLLSAQQKALMIAEIRNAIDYGDPTRRVLVLDGGLEIDVLQPVGHMPTMRASD